MTGASAPAGGGAEGDSILAGSFLPRAAFKVAVQLPSRRAQPAGLNPQPSALNPCPSSLDVVQASGVEVVALVGQGPPAEVDVLVQKGVFSGNDACDGLDAEAFLFLLGGSFAFDLHADLGGSDAVAGVPFEDVDGRGLGVLARADLSPNDHPL